VNHNSSYNHFYTIISVAIFFSFFSRIITFFFPLPNFINLLIFPIIFILFFFIPSIKENNYITKNFILLVIFFIISLISCIINDISLTNFALFLIIVSFPFCLFKFIIHMDQNKFYVKKIHQMLFYFLLINNLISLFQYFILGYRVDDIKGLFLEQGLGHHINGAINFFYSIYYYSLNRNELSLKKIFFIIFCLFINFISDTKSIILVIIFCGILLPILIGIDILFNPLGRKKIKIFLQSMLFSLLLITLIKFVNSFISIPSISHVNYEYLRWGFLSKYNFFNLIEFYSISDYLFGHGPAMVTSKVAYMANTLDRYVNLLNTLNFNYSDLTYLIRKIELNNFITNPTTGSSLFQLTFTNGAVLAEVGIIGFIIYFFLIINMFLYFTDDYFSLLICITVFSMSFIFTWFEESIFIVFILTMLLCHRNRELIKHK